MVKVSFKPKFAELLAINNILLTTYKNMMIIFIYILSCNEIDKSSL
jgi:hypothetical protein